MATEPHRGDAGPPPVPDALVLLLSGVVAAAFLWLLTLIGQ